MGIVEIILIGIGLSMDASCVSMSNGMCYKLKLKMALCVGAMFGIFQGIMPIIGYYAGSIFSNTITAYDHWIALILLSIIGGKMIYDGIKSDHDAECLTKLTFKALTIQAVATSIDALAVGVSFAALDVNIYWASLVIAVSTFVLSVVAVFVGNKIGTKLNRKAEIFGGVILVLIGLKILIEHSMNL